MAQHRPEINHWLLEKGYSQGEVEKILAALDAYDQHTHRESLFEDLSSGDFDIDSIIDEALKEE